MYTCKICSATIKQFRRHLTMVHDMAIEDYYVLFPGSKLEIDNIDIEMKKLRRVNSPLCMEFYQKRGIDDISAKNSIDKIVEKAKKSKVSVELYLAKGFDLQTAQNKVCSYRKRIGKLPTLEELIRQYGFEEGQARWEHYQYKIKNRSAKFRSKYSDPRAGLIMSCLRAGFGKNKKQQLSYTDFKSYAKYCRTLTNLVIQVYRDILDPDGDKLSRRYGKDGFSLDHKFSIYGGFYHKIDPFKICSLQNLQVITKNENSRKSQFCVISLEEVLSYKTLLDEIWLDDEVKEEIYRVYC